MTGTTIESVTVEVFATRSRTFRDAEGHDHPRDGEVPAEGRMLVIRDSDGVEGRALAGGDYLRPAILDGYIRPILLGKDPLRRELLLHELYLAQRGAYGRLHDRALASVDSALWDLTGLRAGLPVWKLLGGFRDRVPAYASTMCGDEVPGGLSSPRDYAAFATQLVAEGYRGVKLHTWMPPVSFAPSVRRDIEACAAVRDAVGPDIALMLDSYHWYSRSDALTLAKELEDLDFAWMEEPMDEYSMTSYRWLAEQTTTAIAGPESVDGGFRSRAEWAASGAVDILRIGVSRAGSIGTALKVCALAESFGMDCEIHGGGAANLAVLAAAPTARWYEAGLLHPHLDSKTPPPHLTRVLDAIDDDGMVRMPEEAGLGQCLDLDYIAANRVRLE